MRLKWHTSRVTLTNASGASMKVEGEARVYAAAEDGKTKAICVIVSPDLVDSMLLGWQSQISLGILHTTWPQGIPQARCQQVKHEEKDKNKQMADFPVDVKYQKVRDLLEEYQDVFHDKLEETDRLYMGCWISS